VKRRTLAGPAGPIAGRGIHGGAPARVRILPAPPGSGLRFRRTDLPGSPELGGGDLVRDAAEGGRTTLRRGAAAVQTVEHLAAAVWGLGLDDVLVEIEGPEPPAADGSALPFAQAILAAGLVEAGGERPAFRPASPLAVSEGAAAAVCLPRERGLRLGYLLDYPGEPLAQGSAALEVDPETFLRELAPARTFCPAAQVEKYRQLGWGRGADTSNTLVLEGGRVRDNRLRFPDEPVRHKMLDMLGDMAFLGGELVAEVRGARSGHRLNRELLSRVIELCRVRNGGAAVMEVNQIRRMLAHRYPFLLVDRVLELEPGKRILGFKNLSVNEEFFQGHFPNLPVMPGVLQLEALAQLGGILLETTLGEAAQGKVPVLATIDQAKLRHAVVPGDQLVMEVFLDRMRGSFGQCHGTASVDGKLVAEAVIRFALVPAGDLQGQKGS
jgi:UDP-3-O-[3-hydroxymyristoyl] N-acetylglucosamine deacetylase/3-hydroxyacyl-[acyl-carrier-protein] dehydratase